MDNRIVVLITTLALIGCVAQTQYIYVNAHPEKHDFKKDRYECLQSSAQATPPATATATDAFGNLYSYDVNAGNRDKLMEACMNAKDWTLQAVPQAPKTSVGGE